MAVAVLPPGVKRLPAVNAPVKTRALVSVVSWTDCIEKNDEADAGVRPVGTSPAVPGAVLLELVTLKAVVFVSVVLNATGLFGLFSSPKKLFAGSSN